MSQTIVVNKTTKEIKAQKNGDAYWGVEDAETGLWYNVFVVEQPLKGQTLVIDVNESSYKGRVYRWSKLLAKPGGAPQQTQPKDAKDEWASPPANPPAPAKQNVGRQTPYTQSWDTYQDLARKAHALAMELEQGPDGARARMAFVHTCLMALGDGKLTLDEPADTWDTEGKGVIDFKSKLETPARVKQEKSAAHDHLTQVLTAAAILLNVGADTLLKEHSPYKQDSFTQPDDVLYLTEKEAIQTRLSLEKLIDEKTEWRAKLTIDIKQYCNKAGIDFAKEKTDILKAVAGTTDFAKVDQALAKKACAVLKEQYADRLMR